MPSPSNAHWRTSSLSRGDNDCVEVAPLESAVAVRDSKDPGGPRLTFNRSEWDDFIADAKSGQLG